MRKPTLLVHSVELDESSPGYSNRQDAINEMFGDVSNVVLYDKDFESLERFISDLKNENPKLYLIGQVIAKSRNSAVMPCIDYVRKYLENTRIVSTRQANMRDDEFVLEKCDHVLYYFSIDDFINGYNKRIEKAINDVNIIKKFLAEGNES